MKSRQHKQCGGVGLFIRNSLKYKLRDDLCIDTPDVIESIFIELDCYNMVITINDLLLVKSRLADVSVLSSTDVDFIIDTLCVS